jgi:hypothetical protein
MPYVRDLIIPQLNTPELIDALGKYLLSKNVKKNSESLVFRVPGTLTHSESCGIGVSPVVAYLYAGGMPNLILATAQISPFVQHCGIRTIGHMRINMPEIGKLFLDTVEAWVHSYGYSALVGGDGQSALYVTRNAIKEYGTGWTFVEGQNRRMKKEMSIYYKMKLEPAFEIDWKKSIQVTV